MDSRPIVVFVKSSNCDVVSATSGSESDSGRGGSSSGGSWNDGGNKKRKLKTCNNALKSLLSSRCRQDGERAKAENESKPAEVPIENESDTPRIGQENSSEMSGQQMVVDIRHAMSCRDPDVRRVTPGEQHSDYNIIM